MNTFLRRKFSWDQRLVGYLQLSTSKNEYKCLEDSHHYNAMNQLIITRHLRYSIVAHEPCRRVSSDRFSYNWTTRVAPTCILLINASGKILRCRRLVWARNSFNTTSYVSSTTSISWCGHIPCGSNCQKRWWCNRWRGWSRAWIRHRCSGCSYSCLRPRPKWTQISQM
jgi:hypothetical protein